MSEEAEYQFAVKLERFKNAAAELCEEWNGSQMVTGYPSYLPSFDEFLLDVLGIEAVKQPTYR